MITWHDIWIDVDLKLLALMEVVIISRMVVWLIKDWTRRFTTPNGNPWDLVTKGNLDTQLKDLLKALTTHSAEVDRKAREVTETVVKALNGENAVICSAHNKFESEFRRIDDAAKELLHSYRDVLTKLDSYEKTNGEKMERIHQAMTSLSIRITELKRI